jgi:hypothetical protein
MVNRVTPEVPSPGTLIHAANRALVPMRPVVRISFPASGRTTTVHPRCWLSPRPRRRAYALIGFHVQRAVGAHVRFDDVRSVETGGGEKPSFIVFDVVDDGGIDVEGCLSAPCRPIVAEADERPRLTYADLHDEGAGKATDIHRYMVTKKPRGALI